MPLLLGRWDNLAYDGPAPAPPPQDSGSQTSNVRRMLPHVHPVTGKAVPAKGLPKKESVTHELEKALGLS